MQKQSEIHLSCQSQIANSSLALGAQMSFEEAQAKEKQMRKQEIAKVEFNSGTSIAQIGDEELTEVQILQRRVEALQLALEQREMISAKVTSKKSKSAFVYTPFQATKDLNIYRRQFGLKDVNPPMLYIYARKSAFIISIVDGKKCVDKESFEKWMIEHTARQLKKS